MSDWEAFCDGMGWANDEDSTDRLIDHIDRGNEKEDEHDLREQGYKTVKEWNAVGRSVRMGEKGTYLRYAKIRMFSESQTAEGRINSQTQSLANKLYFQTFEEAMMWAKSNPGKVITRSSPGEGYIGK